MQHQHTMIVLALYSKNDFMSAYKEETATWIDKTLAGVVIVLTAVIAMMPTPKVNLSAATLATLAALLCTLFVLVMLRSGWLIDVFLTKCRLPWVVAISAVLGAVFGKHDWLVSALAWSLLAAGAWLALLVSLNVGCFIARVVLWPALMLAKWLSRKPARVQRGSYASTSTRGSIVSAPRRYSAGAARSGPVYAAAGAATGCADGSPAWGMLDPMNAMNLLPPIHETTSFPLVNTNGMPMIEGSMIDVTNHSYGDPAPIFEATPIYDYTPSCDYSNNDFGGGFDF